MKEYKTLKDIIKFFIKDKHSDEMSIRMDSMKLLMKIYKNPDLNINFLIGFNSLYAKKCEIFIKEIKYDKHESNLDFNTIVLQDHPILAYRENGKDYVVKTIGIDNEAIFCSSEASMQIRNQYRDSKDAVEKFNL